MASVDLASGVEHVGGHARGHEVKNAHAGAFQLAAKRLAERDDAGLGGGVGGGGRKPGVAADAGVVHDLPVVALDHPGQQQLRQVDEPDEVHLEHRVDVVDLLLLEQAAGHQPGVVHEQIQLRQRGRRGVDRVSVREVHAHRPHLHRTAVRHVERLEALGVAHAAQEQRERAARELRGDRAADAAVRSGHERCLSCEIHRG